MAKNTDQALDYRLFKEKRTFEIECDPTGS